MLAWLVAAALAGEVVDLPPITVAAWPATVAPLCSARFERRCGEVGPWTTYRAGYTPSRCGATDASVDVDPEGGDERAQVPPAVGPWEATWGSWRLVAHDGTVLVAFAAGREVDVDRLLVDLGATDATTAFRHVLIEAASTGAEVGSPFAVWSAVQDARVRACPDVDPTPAPARALATAPDALGYPLALADDVVRRRWLAWRHCYRRALVDRPSLAGDVTVELSVAADGTIAAARGGGALGDDPVGSCVVDTTRSLQLPQPRRPVLLRLAVRLTP